VIAPRKEAEANLIARPEETAVARSPGQHGQAAGGKPAAGASKELELLQRMWGAKTTFVFRRWRHRR